MTASPVRTLLLGIVALTTLLLIAGAALSMLDGVAHSEKRTVRPLPAGETIDIAADNGDIAVVRAAAGERPSLETIEQSGLFGGPDVSIDTRGGRIHAVSDCDDFVFGTGCDVDMVLRVPAGTAVRIDTGSGDVDLAGVGGPVDVDTGSGDVDIVGADGAAVLVSTGSGDVRVAGSRGDRVGVESGSGDVEVRDGSADEVLLDTSSGDIDADLRTPPRRLAASSGSGDLTAVLPDAPYEVATDTGSGDEDIDVRQDPDASNRLLLETGSGDITVRRR